MTIIQQALPQCNFARCVLKGYCAAALGKERSVLREWVPF